MDKFDLKKYLTEGKILKENTSESPEYKEGETFLERYEHSNIVERFSKNLSKEEYDFYVKNGEDAFFDKYPNATGDFVFIDRPIDNSTKEDEYKIVVDDNIDENKSTNQIKENTTKYEPFEKGETFLRRSEIFDGKRDERMDIETKEQYDYLIENGVEAFLDNYEDESDIDKLFFEPERFAEYEENSRYEYSLGEIGYLIPISENKSTTQLKEYKIK